MIMVHMSGRFEPWMVDVFADWMESGAGLGELHLLAGEEPVWQHWEYGYEWLVHLTPAEFAVLEQELQSVLGPEIGLMWVGR